MIAEDKLKIVPSLDEPIEPHAVQTVADERDEIEDLIASFTEADDAWKVTVYRLRGVGRTDSASPRAFLATLPVTEDLLDVLRSMFGEGDYSLEFKQRGKIKRRGTTSIAPLPRNEPDDEDLADEAEGAEVNEQAERLDRLETLMLQLVEQRRGEAQQPQAMPVQPNPVAQMRDAFAMMKEFQAFNTQLNPSPVAPAAPVAQADDEEKALLMLLKDTALRSRVASSLNSLLSTEQPEKTTLESVLSVFQNPAIANRALDVVGNIVARVLPSPAQPPAVAAPMGSPSTVTSEASDDPEEDEEEMTSEQVIVRLLADCVANVPVSESAEFVRECIRDYPGNAATFAAMMNAPTETLLGMVTQNIEGGAEIAKLPHARKWLEGLQKALRDGAP